MNPNKGKTKHMTLLSGICELISQENLTVGELHTRLGNGMSYRMFTFLLYWARKNGLVDLSLIKEGRGGKPKFKVGAKVRIRRDGNQHTPKCLLREIRVDSPRTIVAAFPGGRNKPILYYLGTNKHNGTGELERHAFWADELTPYTRQAIGRPKTKRQYSRNSMGKGIVLI